MNSKSMESSEPPFPGEERRTYRRARESSRYGAGERRSTNAETQPRTSKTPPYNEKVNAESMMEAVVFYTTSFVLIILLAVATFGSA